MKKILMALAITVIAYSGAEAQVKCGTNEKKVCRRASNGNTACYETKYAQNFKVCKGDDGYHICCKGLDNVSGDKPDELTYTPPGNYDAYEAAFPEDNAMAQQGGATTTTTYTYIEDNTAKEKPVAATVNCGTNEKQVCRKTANGSVACYKTGYAQNYKVCKGANGYYICCNPQQTARSNNLFPPRM